MLLAIIFFCVALGLPLAAAFDTELCLNDDFLNSLPEDVASPARTLKNLLDRNPFLHFDQHQNWGSNEFRFFDDEYFPVLQELVIAAAHYPELVKEFGVGMGGQKVVRLLSLGLALEHLLDIRYRRDHTLESSIILDESIATPGTNWSQQVARAKFEALRNLVGVWLFLDPDMNSFGSEWSFQTPIIGPMIKISCLSEISGRFNMQIPGVPMIFTVEDSWEDVDEANCPLMEQELQALANELKDALQQQQKLFDELRGAVDNFIKSGCSQFQLMRLVKIWGSSGCVDPLVFPSALPPLDDVRFKMIFLQREAITLENRQRAQLAGEIVLLQLQLAESIEPNYAFLRIVKLIPTYVERLNPKFEQVAETIGNFVAAHQESSAEELMEGLSNWPELSWGVLAHKQRALQMLEKVRSMDLQGETIMQFDEETLKALKDTYDRVKRIVEAYAAILELGVAKGLEQSQMDRLVITIFKPLFTREALPLYKSFMGRVEAAFAAGDMELEAYNWDYFPLHFILHPPGSKSAASGTVSGEGKQGAGKDESMKMEFEG